MIHLKETPILLEFLEKLFKFKNIGFNFKFEDLDCASVKIKLWKEEF